METNEQYDEVIANCRHIFMGKTKDYGTAWRVLRPISIADQIFIKAQRIRTIQENKKQKVEDDVPTEFAGIINYAIIGNIQLHLPNNAAEEMGSNMVSKWYDTQVTNAKKLMLDKNHDYGEAWRSMSQESFVDLILMKIQRIRQIITNEGKTVMSEGLAANFYDILNYAIFALIKINEKES
ncbi:MAG: DUF1599 domain-containing protein [Chitinophagaceae bacterium]